VENVKEKTGKGEKRNIYIFIFIKQKGLSGGDNKPDVRVNISSSGKSENIISGRAGEWHGFQTFDDFHAVNSTPSYHAHC
jgi:hypothetical protein